MLYFIGNYLLSFSSGTIYAQTPPSITLNIFSSGYSSPLCIKNCGDSRLFIVEQRGKIYICDSVGNKKPTPFIDLSDRVSQSGSERGLLGLAFDPNYASNGFFYVNYTATAASHATRISRFSVSSTNPDIAIPSSEVILLTVTQPYSNHNGGDIHFGPDGYLYIGMGDGGSGGDPQNYAQNPQSLLGKMLRIDVAGGQTPYQIPPDNPFASSTTTRPEIWAIGYRNPWRYSFDAFTGDMWVADVGQNVIEEVNFEPATSNGGLNYGWRCYEGSSSYNSSGCGSASSYVMPIFEYDHALGCSITGGEVYRGAQFADLFGIYLVADYCSGRFWVIQQNTGGIFTSNLIENFTDYDYAAFGADKHNELYVAGLSSGNIYKINSDNCAPMAYIQGNASYSICSGDPLVLKALEGTGLTYQWQKDGFDIVGAVADSLEVSAAGNYTVRVGKSSGCSAISLSSTVSVMVKDTPAPVISGVSVVCEGDIYTYSVAAVSGHTYTWAITSGNGMIMSGQGTNSISVHWTSGAVGSISISEVNP